MAGARHTPWQPLQNHPSGHLGGWVTPWSAEGMLDGQHQRVDIPTRTSTAHKGLQQRRLEENLCWIFCHVSLTTQSVKGLNWIDKVKCLLSLTSISFWLMLILALLFHFMFRISFCPLKKGCILHFVFQNGMETVTHTAGVYQYRGEGSVTKHTLW